MDSRSWGVARVWNSMGDRKYCHDHVGKISSATAGTYPSLAGAEEGFSEDIEF